MSHENVEVVRRVVARWGADDYDVLLDFLISIAAPDIELYSRFGGLSGEPYRGHDGVRAWVADIRENFERFGPWLDEARAVGEDRVVVLGGIKGRARESGGESASRSTVATH